ncbi:MAG: hypothetical protein ACUVXJ_17265 [Phycisphaerae bacterium]
MRRLLSLTLAIAIMMAAPVAISGAPPSRPLPLTPAQFNELQKLQADEEHAAVVDIRASFKSEHEQQLERTRFADDISTGVMLIGYPALIVGLLICAAPL